MRPRDNYLRNPPCQDNFPNCPPVLGKTGKDNRRRSGKPNRRATFGTDYEAATRHYITNGYHELRTDEPLDATSLQVVASDEAEVSAAGLDFLL